MSILAKLLSSRQNQAAQTTEAVQSYADGCVKCGKLRFEYDEYFKDYTCYNCGWTINEEPKGEIEIIKTNLADNAEKSENKAKDSSISQAMPLGEMNKIIQEYGSAMVHKAPPAGGVADESNLPYPKSKIKKAVIQALCAVDGPEMATSLKHGYLKLSDWQEDVGEQSIGIDLSKFGMILDTDERVDAYLEQESQIEKWKNQVNDEMESLQDDLEKLGLWGE
jgi:hypothetical protein